MAIIASDAPFCFVGSATPVVAPRHWFLGLSWRLGRKLEVGKDLMAKGLVKSWGHPRFLFIGLVK
jgi:hypothetical protein